MARNWLRRVKNSKIKIDNIVFTDEEPRWQEKFKLKKKGPKTNIYRLN
jgi:hypothetical protein